MYATTRPVFEGGNGHTGHLPEAANWRLEKSDTPSEEIKF